MLSTASELGEGHPGFTRESKTWRRYHSKATKVTANGDLRGNSHDYGKGGSTLSDARCPCWLGTLPWDLHLVSLLSCTTSLSTTERRRGPRTPRSRDITTPRGRRLLASVLDAFPGWAGGPLCVCRPNLKRGWQRTSSSSGSSLLWLHPHWLKSGRRRTQRSWRHWSGTATCLKKIKTRENVSWCCSRRGREGRWHGDMTPGARAPAPGRPGVRGDSPRGEGSQRWAVPTSSSPAALLEQERTGRRGGREKRGARGPFFSSTLKHQLGGWVLI